MELDMLKREHEKEKAKLMDDHRNELARVRGQANSERDAAAPVLSVAVLPAMAAKRASAPRGHLRTYLLSAHVCRAPTRPVCLAACCAP